MQCARCQHENRPQAKFCEECASPLNEAGPVTPSHAADLKAEVESLRQALTEALERETVTSGILRAIAMSSLDPEPVFDAILENALRLCKASIGVICLFDGQTVSLVALRARAESVELVRATYPRGPKDVGLAVQAIRTGRFVHVADTRQDSSSHRMVDEATGLRGEVAVPMWREGRCIGAIAVARP